MSYAQYSYVVTDELLAEHNSFEDRPWINRLVEYTKKAIGDDRVRILGICFGHQIIGRALGVKVGRSEIGWEIAVSQMDLTEQGKKLFGKDKLVRCSYSSLDLLSFGEDYRC